RQCELFSCSRPARSLDRSRRSGGRRRRSTATSTIEGWRLLDRMPFLLILRDDAGEDVLVRIIPAFLLVGPALLLADPGVQVLAIGPLDANVSGRARFRAHVVGHETERAVEDGLEHAEIAGSHLLLALGRAGVEQVVPELAILVGAIENGELKVEHLALPV